MKKTLCALSFALLSLSSLQADYVKKAISKGRPDAIKALVKAGFTYSQEAKNEYIELAEAKLEKKKEALDSVSLAHLAGPDLALAGVNGTSLVASAYMLWAHHYKNTIQAKKGASLLDVAFFTSALTSTLKSLITLYKDVKKRDKKIEAVEKAEKVLRAVKALKVSVPQIAAY